MLIQHIPGEKEGTFFYAEEKVKLAEMLYTKPSVGKIIIEHTAVNKQLRGRNIGYHLVKAAVDYARQHLITIIPVCPFANATFKKHPELQDVLFKN